MNLDLVDADDPDVERIWRSLEIHARSYFLSWGWLSTWLAALPAHERPALAVLHDDRAVSGAFFLAERRVRRSLVLQKSALYFNATGSPRHDLVGPDRNTMLVVPGAPRSLAAVLDLLPDGWDELHLPALDHRAFADVVATSARYPIVVERDEQAPFVDLTAPVVHPTRGLRIEVARDVEHAMAIYRELVDLHDDTLFDDPWRDTFHRRLIRARLAHGEIQLMRIRSGDTTLGCLYNLVHGGRVVAYASAIARHADAGPLAHAAAIAHNHELGHATYHLFGGQTRFAAQLATDTERLTWLRVERPVVQLASLEATARRWYARLVGDRMAHLALI